MIKVEILYDADAVALAASALIEEAARSAVAERGRFTLALSGGATPQTMLRALAEKELPWDFVHLFQVDERVAPRGHSDRNLTQLSESLLAHVPLAENRLHPMPVEDTDLRAAAADYAVALRRWGGEPPVLDFVHLGLGSDGHTASLVPGDGRSNVTDLDVAVSGVYQGRRRMTLTYRVLNRARRILWLVTGESKAEALARLRRGDASMPAGRVCRDRALVLADWAAAGDDR